MAVDGPEVPPALRAAYHARCDEAGVSLAAFLEEARGDHPAAALRALLDAVEADMLENVALMAGARPELEAVAAERVATIRREMAALKASLEGGG